MAHASLDGGRAKMGSEMKSGSSLGLCVTQVTFNRCRTQAVYGDASRRGRTAVLDAFPAQYLSLSRTTRKRLDDGRPMRNEGIDPSRLCQARRCPRPKTDFP
jgi:hypothetical protein